MIKYVVRITTSFCFESNLKICLAVELYCRRQSGTVSKNERLQNLAEIATANCNIFRTQMKNIMINLMLVMMSIMWYEITTVNHSVGIRHTYVNEIGLLSHDCTSGALEHRRV